MASLRTGDENPLREESKNAARLQRTEETEPGPRKPAARSRGLEYKKISSQREALSLDIPLYRTTPEFASFLLQNRGTAEPVASRPSEAPSRLALPKWPMPEQGTQAPFPAPAPHPR